MTYARAAHTIITSRSGFKSVYSNEDRTPPPALSYAITVIIIPPETLAIIWNLARPVASRPQNSSVDGTKPVAGMSLAYSLRSPKSDLKFVFVRNDVARVVRTRAERVHA
jgi:hypothetical protein